MHVYTLCIEKTQVDDTNSNILGNVFMHKWTKAIRGNSREN